MATDAAATARRPPHPLGGLILVGMALAVWWPAFTLGAWGTLFFDQLLTIWVVSTAGFVIVLMQPRPFPHRLGKSLALLVPSLWLALAFLLSDETDDFGVFLVDLVGILVALIGMPFTLVVLVRVVWPDFGHGLTRGRKVVVTAAFVAIALGSFVLGASHPYFLTCEDFAISGNSEPPGCVHAEPTTP
ncbi:hypothetical protein GE115_07380 [Agromyces sp. CFH 90414]|uniref:Uncharacterized protein n=1 Tax=Agromyces agglutinans TaxID=2662258 RepID=A0A6I2F4Y1_9MICO|nr:hypothetical protein [Agromyces agglutinans]MRG59692.1 hypothetical protein [Agromyces agglutinans]